MRHRNRLFTIGLNTSLLVIFIAVVTLGFHQQAVKGKEQDSLFNESVFKQSAPAIPLSASQQLHSRLAVLNNRQESRVTEYNYTYDFSRSFDTPKKNQSKEKKTSDKQTKEKKGETTNSFTTNEPSTIEETPSIMEENGYDKEGNDFKTEKSSEESKKNKELKTSKTTEKNKTTTYSSSQSSTSSTRSTNSKQSRSSKTKSVKNKVYTKKETVVIPKKPASPSKKDDSPNDGPSDKEKLPDAGFESSKSSSSPVSEGDNEGVDSSLPSDSSKNASSKPADSTTEDNKKPEMNDDASSISEID